eukprot:scaffold19146_cov29-Tisochrysis_lutea.AAC.1
MVRSTSPSVLMVGSIEGPMHCVVLTRYLVSTCIAAPKSSKSAICSTSSCQLPPADCCWVLAGSAARPCAPLRADARATAVPPTRPRASLVPSRPHAQRRRRAPSDDGAPPARHIAARARSPSLSTPATGTLTDSTIRAKADGHTYGFRWKL